MHAEDYWIPHAEDYYKTQGLAFVMLVSALIHQEMEAAVANIEGKNVSTCLLESRMVKAHKRHDNWIVCNCLKKQDIPEDTFGNRYQRMYIAKNTSTPDSFGR